MVIQVTGCNDCPCCDMMDMANGYLCRLMPHGENEIMEDKKTFMAETPKWCPLMTEEIVLKRIPSDKELTEFASALSLNSLPNTTTG